MDVNSCQVPEIVRLLSEFSEVRVVSTGPANHFLQLREMLPPEVPVLGASRCPSPCPCPCPCCSPCPGRCHCQSWAHCPCRKRARGRLGFQARAARAELPERSEESRQLVPNVIQELKLGFVQPSLTPSSAPFNSEDTRFRWWKPSQSS